MRHTEGDLLVASIHWGPNWGYEIPLEHRVLAHELIDAAGFAIVHGHSSHAREQQDSAFMECRPTAAGCERVH